MTEEKLHLPSSDIRLREIDFINIGAVFVKTNVLIGGNQTETKLLFGVLLI